MIIISHRGYWKEPSQKNSILSFKNSFNLGCGTETDVRDHAGELVISHDPPLGNEIKLSEFLNLLKGTNYPLALNIKSDGLAKKINDVMTLSQHSNWFVFDMTIPDMQSHLTHNNPVYTRLSDIETQPYNIDRAIGIWLDAFYSDGWQLAQIDFWLKKNKKVCVVSPELHGRDHYPFWSKLLLSSSLHHSNLALCTDHPEKAQKFFGSKS